MRATGSSSLLSALALVFLLGCTPDSPPTAVDGPAFSHTGIPDINGNLFVGAGTQNLCSRFPLDPTLFIRAFTAEGGIAATNVFCPDNAFSIPVEPGSYFLRVSLPFDEPRGRLPLRWLETTPVDVQDADAFREIHVREGTRLGGRARVDGVPVAGVAVNAVYQIAPLAGVAGSGISTANGTWEDAFQGGPVYLQRNVDLAFTGCVVNPVPGIREINVTPAGSVLFPTEGNALNCDYFSGDALQYTHRATRLKLTSFPGDIGGGSDPLIFPEIGYGYTAQFPLPAGAAPVAGPAPVNRQLFRGGLVLAVAPDLAISGTELEGFVICAVSPCRSLGFDGQASVRERAGGRRDITWTYSDAGSLRPRGLRVVQRSFDGQNGDYVLYAFRITNESREAITLTPGLFFDFDVSPEFFSNTGYTELEGQLMITTTADDVGRHLGSIVLGAPEGGRSYFFTSFDFIPESDVVAAIRGEISNPAVETPDDVRALQGGATVKLKKGKSTEFWAAVVAGDDRAQTVASARAAVADATARRRAGNVFAASTGERMTQPSVRPATRSAARVPAGRICKRGCAPD